MSNCDQTFPSWRLINGMFIIAALIMVTGYLALVVTTGLNLGWW